MPLKTCVVVLNVAQAGKPAALQFAGTGTGYAPGAIVTVKLLFCPKVKVAVLVLLIAGAWLTVNTKVWVAFGKNPFDAVKFRLYVPPVPAAGVPLRVAVPSPLLTKETPFGNAEPFEIVGGIGMPVVVIVKEPALPTVNVVAATLVMAGA